ncbi:hypothetical protein T05_15179 [Trichinella murrelli]|uniref:Uncharacterized protein n=1 Tax=Trichinella murrelli TaxID=144512 RepID=A0A0V0T5Z8_9BILA|nr:hypothetical protein T05_15179 [Trichinella murrelli]
MNCSPLISTPVIMQPRRYLQILKLLLVYEMLEHSFRIYRKQCLALRTSDTNDKVPAMRRAPGSEGDPSDVKVTKFHASKEHSMSGYSSLRVEASNVAQPASKSLKQHSYPAEEIILVARMIFYFIFTLDKRGSIIFDPQVATRDSHVKNEASTSSQLAEQKQIKKWMALKTTDTKGKTPAMGRARRSGDLPLSWMPFNTLYITLHSDEPP